MTIYGPKKGVAFKIRLPLVTFGSGDWKTSPTLAAGDFKVSKDGGALANLATLPTVEPAGSAWVLFDLSATEMNADIVQIQAIDQTSPKEWEDTGAAIITTAAGLAQAGDAMALTSAERNSTADALLDRANAIETGTTPRQALRYAAAVAAGTTAGAGTDNEVFNGIGTSTPRVTVTVNADGERSAVTLG